MPMPPETHSVAMPRPGVAPLHLVEERRGDARAGRSDRMAERDRAAVDVDAREVDREVARARDHLRREGLVQLDQVDVRERCARSSRAARGPPGTGPIPMRAGSTPAEVHAATRPSGSTPDRFGRLFGRQDQSGAAVRDAGGVARVDGALRIEHGRQLRERLRGRIGPRMLVLGDHDFALLRPGPATGTISSAKRPAWRAAAARRCEPSAYASCSARRMPYSRASVSAVSPMSWPQSGHRNPSRYMPSTTSVFPIRIPKRARGNRYGVADMHSVPPASTTSFSPAAIVRAPSVMAFSEEAQALLTVKAGTESGNPARRPTCRAVFGPPPAWRACPKIVSSTAGAGSPERSIAARAAAAPSSAGVSDAKDPPNFPIGVRTAESTYTGRIGPTGYQDAVRGRLRAGPERSEGDGRALPLTPTLSPLAGGEGVGHGSSRRTLQTARGVRSHPSEARVEAHAAGAARSEESAGRSSPHPGEPPGGARRRGAQTPNAAEATS